ncbi:MAG: amidinotransferase [Chitinophagaceae bacterium]|nr:amidinotransferase [Chitinophagaceae bacterium]
MQTTSHLLMIRPVNFAFNAETAVNNAFQVAGETDHVQETARREFDGFVTLLRENGVDVTVVEDTPVPHTPDSIFPNNWISFHADGTILLYPMFAPNRRSERKPHVLQAIADRFAIRQTLDLTGFEQQHLFLEGTGSMVLDRDQQIAYACLSPRTDRTVLEEFCTKMHYHAVIFDAVDADGQPIYHTNVMMCVADRYVVICLDSIPDAGQRQLVSDSITGSGKAIITISLDQMAHFAGNMLQVQNISGERLLIMSSQAFQSLNQAQLKQLTAFNRILHAPLNTIERNGGGSARCMLAEIHLPVKA